MPDRPSSAPPKVLVVSEYSEMSEGMGLFDTLSDLDQGGFDLDRCSVMDAYMKGVPEGLAMVVLDIGMLDPMHLDVLDSILGGSAAPVLIHLTDDRREVLRTLDERPGTYRIKKPSTLHHLLEVMEEIAAGKEPRLDEED
jgi:hypothetical protein